MVIAIFHHFFFFFFFFFDSNGPCKLQRLANVDLVNSSKTYVSMNDKSG